MGYFLKSVIQNLGYLPVASVSSGYEALDEILKVGCGSGVDGYKFDWQYGWDRYSEGVERKL